MLEKCIDKSMNAKQIYNKAFTLAEVLITLGVIGVIAALTIPTLVANYQKIQYFTAFKKGYAEVSQIVEALILENGDIASTISSYGDLTKAISSKVKVIKTCPLGTMDGECMPADGIRLDKVAYTTNFSDYDRLVFPDGQAIEIGIQDNNCSTTYSSLTNFCGVIDLDTNGVKPPNQKGRDIFQLVLANNKLYAEGDPAAGNHVWSSSFDWYCNPTIADPNSGGSCASRLLQENAMNY